MPVPFLHDGTAGDPHSRLAAKDLDDLVAEGRFASRTAAVRTAVHELVAREKRRAVDEAILAGYRRVPETDDELANAEHNLRRLVAEEPW